MFLRPQLWPEPLSLLLPNSGSLEPCPQLPQTQLARTRQWSLLSALLRLNLAGAVLGLNRESEKPMKEEITDPISEAVMRAKLDGWSGPNEQGLFTRGTTSVSLSVI